MIKDETEFTTDKGYRFVPGDHFRLRSEPGQIYKFIKFSIGEKGAWVSAYGGSKDPKGQRAFRSFHPDLDFVPVKLKKFRWVNA